MTTQQTNKISIIMYQKNQNHKPNNAEPNEISTPPQTQ